MFAAYLRPYLGYRTYKAVIGGLRDAGVIDVDPHFIIGEKSRGYRLTTAYRDQPFRRGGVSDRHLVKAVRRHGPHSVEDATHQHLLANLYRVGIDYAAAERDGRLARPKAELQATLIRDGQYHFEVDDYGRVHSNVANLSRRLRPYLVVDGKGLVNLDVANSQPLFLAMAVIDLELNGGRRGYDLAERAENVTLAGGTRQAREQNPLRCAQPILTGAGEEGKAQGRERSPLRCAQLIDEMPEDLRRYTSLCQAGELYDYLLEAVKGRWTRDVFKKRLFKHWLFCKDHRHYRLGRKLEELFPTVTANVVRLKEHDYRHAAHHLQRTESRLMHRVVTSFRQRQPEAFVGLIHDSVLVHAEFAAEAETLLREAFRRQGITPTIRRDDLARLAPNVSAE